MAENQGYSFTNLQIPKEDQSYFTENLWEVTDSGVYDDKGQPVTSPTASQASASVGALDSKAPSPTGGKNPSNQLRLSGVKENLEDQKARFRSLSDQISETQEKLAPLKEQELQLQEQIDLIDSQIRLTKEKITNVEVMIAEKKIQIKKSLLDLQQSEVEVGIQKEVVLEYIQLLYQEESKFFDLYDKGSSSLKLLLSDQTVAENLAGEEYLSIMGDTGRQVFNDLNKTRQDLAEKQVRILKEQEDLEFLYRQLTDEKKTYEESNKSKKDLLEQTQGEEEKYNLLLEQAQKEQLEAAVAVKNLQNNLDMIQTALGSISGGQSTRNFDDLHLTPEMLELMKNGGSSANALGKPLAWPVPPNKITAEFHDPSYPSKWGFHNAIDIRTPQYTPILAPADAYVSNTKDNGMGYSYIVLAHKDGISTLYGHVSEIMVKVGETVKQGDVIGLSGGAPGTKGAGLQTTGAHLHFEVHLNGTPVDALNYLPVSQLPLEYVPDKHLGDLAIEKAAAHTSSQ